MAVFRKAMIGAAAVGILALPSILGPHQKKDYYGVTFVPVKTTEVRIDIYCGKDQAEASVETSDKRFSSMLSLRNFPRDPTVKGKKQVETQFAVRSDLDFKFLTGAQDVTVGYDIIGPLHVDVAWAGPSNPSGAVSELNDTDAYGERFTCRQKMSAAVVQVANAYAEQLYQFCASRRNFRFLPSFSSFQPSRDTIFEGKSGPLRRLYDQSIKACPQ
jgi:hypothetical protein